jgi:phospholipid/cholesterol/gamma-HCH transport system permease protein
VFSAWCDLREIMPYAFGYMMSAKVGTGLVAEIGRCGSPTRSTRSR